MKARSLLVLAVLLVTALAFSLNIIYLVGDGMSFNQLLLASILEGRVLTTMTLPYTGITTTYSADSWVTDSAPAGSALFGGYKTLNRAIGVLPNGTPMPSMFEIAKRAGYNIGLAVTCRVTHATPAAMYGHVPSRDDEVTLAKQLADSGVVDVIFGGGWDMFVPTAQGGRRTDGLSLIEQMRKNGYEYITTIEQLKTVQSSKVVGLFAKGHLDPVSNRPAAQPTLDVMTQKALEILSKEGKPFMLMVEGSQIDWEAHANDFYGVWKETVEFDNAVRVALEFAAKDGNTLVVVLGDHETGGLSLSKGGYTINVELARKAKGTTAMFLAQYSISDKAKFIAGLREWYGISITDAEYEMMTKIPSNNLRRELARFVSEKVGFGWTTFDHTAAPVPVYAFGPGAHLFTGLMDNTDVPKILLRLTGLSTITFPVAAVSRN
ncbi:alkaline phosphatase [Fervidobacterium sp.]